MLKLFRRQKGTMAPVSSGLSKMIGMLQEQVEGSQIISKQVAGNALSLESLDDSGFRTLEDASSQLSAALESIADNLNMSGVFTPAQFAAGNIGGILAGDIRKTMAHKVDNVTVGTEGIAVVQPFGIDDGAFERAFALEAYDERENRNAVIYSIAYNMQSARQDEFGETFYPTLVLTPDNVGFGVTVNLMMVYDAIERKITGTFEDYKKRNIIRAVVDATVLKKEQTKIVPVARAQAADKFVDPGVVAPYAINLEGESITTAPLKIGTKVDLLALSQTDVLLAAGAMDMTDSVDPYINLQNVYVSFTAGLDTDVLKFNVTNLPLSNFTWSTQDNYRVMTLNFHTNSVLINKNTKQADGSPLAALAGIVAGDLIVRLELALTGRVNIETGETSVFANIIGTHQVTDNAGTLLDMTAVPAAPQVLILNAGKIEGYDLQAYRTNENRRQRGQLIDVTRYTQLYNVPLRSPITTIHPINVDGSVDASDVQALITTTRIRTSNEAVTSLINTASLLSEYVDSRDVIGVGPDVLGVGRFFVRPTYFTEAVDVSTQIDSLKSHERAADLQAVLVNKIRDYAFRMYRDSEYKAAADALNGGISQTPVVIIGTDPVIARYLHVTGELRTLGGEFDVRIVSTLDSRVAGKIFITFGIFDENRNVAPNPLNFGNMVWAPELVLTANISRGGSISKETVVQPRYLFVTHMPILTVLTVSNIPDVLNKVAIDFNAV